MSEIEKPIEPLDVRESQWIYAYYRTRSEMPTPSDDVLVMLGKAAYGLAELREEQGREL